MRKTREKKKKLGKDKFSETRLVPINKKPTSGQQGLWGPRIKKRQKRDGLLVAGMDITSKRFANKKKI